MCAQPRALINWVRILTFFFPLILKTGTRLALELDAILRTLATFRERGVLSQYQIDHGLPLCSGLFSR